MRGLISLVRKMPSWKPTSEMESGASASPPSSPESENEEEEEEKKLLEWEKAMRPTTESWSSEKRVCQRCRDDPYYDQAGVPIPLPTGSDDFRVAVCKHFARTWLRDTVMSSMDNDGAKLFLDLFKEEESSTTAATTAAEDGMERSAEEKKMTTQEDPAIVECVGEDLYRTADGKEKARRCHLPAIGDSQYCANHQATTGVSNEDQKWKKWKDEQDRREILGYITTFVKRFLTTGVPRTVSLVGDDDRSRKDDKTATDQEEMIHRHWIEFGARFKGLISVKPSKHEDERGHVERYNVISLEGNWDVLTGEPWKFSKLEDDRRRYGPLTEDDKNILKGKEDAAVSSSADKSMTKWSKPQRATVAAMLMYVVVTNGEEQLPNSFRPIPKGGSEAAYHWKWAIVTDLQSKHDKEGLERAKLLIAILDFLKFLPKAVLSEMDMRSERPETNLRASPKLLEDFQQEHGGIAYMTIDSIEEIASYSRSEVMLLLIGVSLAYAAALLLETGAGFFLLAVLAANSLEQEINFTLFMFVWARLYKKLTNTPIVARPRPHVRANYLMVAGFGIVEALYDDDRVPPSVREGSAMALTVAVFVVALPPLVFVWEMRRRCEYKGPYPLASSQRQDWVRNSVGCFYGSCSECFFGGAGRGYRCADQQGGRLFNWLAGCSVDHVMWTGTSSGGVHHSLNVEMGHRELWAVVG
eukprot:g7322.t1